MESPKTLGGEPSSDLWTAWLGWEGEKVMASTTCHLQKNAKHFTCPVLISFMLN